MLRYPDVSSTHVVFVFANDLWTVPREGGEATLLASPDGPERNPRFSPDGQEIAFIGNYEGDGDLYTLALAGGLPFRVTHQPGTELLTDWAADGRLVFSSSARSGQRRAPKMFTVSSEGGLPAQLPIPYGMNGVLRPDGRWLAYTPNSRDNGNWKRYRGGMATDVWLFDLVEVASRRVTDWEGTDSIPMWHGDKLYYLSDRGPEHRLNIWAYDVDANSHRQVTHFTDFDVKWPSIGPGPAGQGEIVFQNNYGIRLLDLSTGESREVVVTIPGARETLRAESVDVSAFLSSAGVSPTGKRVAAEARGDIWTLPAEKGLPRNLTRTDGVAERDPAWSPDGRWVAYFSDATGEYELCVTQSDGRGETRQLTQDSEGYRYDPTWAPNSKKIAFSDRSGSIYIHDLDAEETTFVAQDDLSEWGVEVAWSHDSRWLTFASVAPGARNPSIQLYDSSSAELHQVTSDMFADGGPTFDRKGDYLYFHSARNFDGLTGSAIDSSYIHRNAEVLLAVPLRDDVAYPWAPESDEETWEEDDENDDESAGGDDSKEEDSEGDADAAEEGSEDDAEDGDGESGDASDDGISGSWKGTLEIPQAGEFPFTMTLRLLPGGILEGSVSTQLGSGELSGDYDSETGAAEGEIETNEGLTLTFEGAFSGGSLNATFETPDGTGTMSGERVSAGVLADSDADGEEGDGDEASEVVEIDLEGFERRALLLPVKSGNFSSLAVNDKHQLLYARNGDGGGIKLFDIGADDPAEKSVTSGGGFGLSGDGKHIVVRRGRAPAIGKAAEGSKPKKVKTDGMMARIDPRNEWPQLYTDAWRLFRDYFYAGNMHGVDWQAIYDQYRPMIDACATRNDVDYVLRETVAELNCGHTYIRGGDMERGPRVGVGLLGCDFELHDGAYRIARIIEGAAWDADARGPLSRTGVAVREGDYLLAVNGVPLDVSKDPWVAFVGLAGKSVELTVNDRPTWEEADDASAGDENGNGADGADGADGAGGAGGAGDSEATEDALFAGLRRVWVKTLSSESNLRYRAWIESNRNYVFEKSGGRVGYIYVPDTGPNGRNNFFRQLYGQVHLDALVIDERWNGGGQFPSREIEALNRPRTNYWGRRWGRSWPTPNDSHQGPKCMLINRDSGSGGDMFPYLFKQAGLGKLIGTRTWGGLVGYSGSPALIDGGTLAIPSFGFYELDGSWGVEGHGVDPDLEVMDDPALMQNGADPQLDAAVATMLTELETGAYQPPQRPSDPGRRGMGLPAADRNSFSGSR